MPRSELSKERSRSGCPGAGQKLNSQGQAVKRIEQRTLKKRSVDENVSKINDLSPFNVLCSRSERFRKISCCFSDYLKVTDNSILGLLVVLNRS
jgi:hypothetical protein